MGGSIEQYKNFVNARNFAQCRYRRDRAAASHIKWLALAKPGRRYPHPERMRPFFSRLGMSQQCHKQ
jgi:hypothetical protein